MHSTSRWLASLAVVLVVAGFVLLRQAPETETARSGPGAELADAPATLPVPAEPAAPAVELPLEPESRAATPLSDAPPDGPTAVVTGRVVDEGGMPVANVRIILFAAEEDQDFEQAFAQFERLIHPDSRCVSAADGSFRLEEPADGRCMLALAPPGGSTQLATGLVVLPGATVELGDVLLRAPQTITGSVSDEQHRPIAGAEVLVTDSTSLMAAAIAMADQPESQLLEMGTVPNEAWVQSFVRAMPQSALVHSGRDGRFEAKLVKANDKDAIIMARATGYTMALQAPGMSGGDIVLRRAASRIAGRVRCADGRPPPHDTFVRARSASVDSGPLPFGRIVPAAPDGHFEIEGLLDGPCNLVASSPDTLPSAPVQVEAGTLDAQLVLRPPVEILVHVTHDGDAVDEFDLGLSRPPRMLRPRLPWSWRHAGPRAHGLLRLAEVGTDELTLQAFAGELCSLPQVARATDEAPRVEISLPLDEGRRLSGVVVLEGSGEPVAGVRVSAGLQGQAGPALARAVTDAKGRFRLGPIPHAASLLEVQAGGIDDTLMDIPADSTDPLVVEVTRRSVVHVRPGPVLRVAMHRGKVTPTDSEFSVRAVSLDSQRDAVVRKLSPTGVFFDGLAPGRYQLELGNVRSSEFTVPAGELVTVEF